MVKKNKREKIILCSSDFLGKKTFLNFHEFKCKRVSISANPLTY
jgi:hypothetical protein